MEKPIKSEYIMNKVKKIKGTYNLTEETYQRLEDAKEATGISKSIIVERGVKKELTYLEKNYAAAYDGACL